jgi:hypothetical protein
MNSVWDVFTRKKPDRDRLANSSKGARIRWRHRGAAWLNRSELPLANGRLTGTNDQQWTEGHDLVRMSPLMPLRVSFRIQAWYHYPRRWRLFTMSQLTPQFIPTVPGLERADQ